jgi:hypothetical protein
MSRINRGINVVSAAGKPARRPLPLPLPLPRRRRRVFNARRCGMLRARPASFIHERILRPGRLGDKRGLRATRQLDQSKIAAVVVEAFSV